MCRICLEDDVVENLISPCKCSGSQKYVHLRCVRKWQQSQRHRAVRCNICQERYTCKLPKKPWIQKLVFDSWGTIAMIAIVMATLPMYISPSICLALLYLRVQNLVPVFINGRVRLVRQGEPVDDLRRMMFLVAQDRMPSSSVFYQSVILLTEHSSHTGSVGFIINKRSPFAPRKPWPQELTEPDFTGPPGRYSVWHSSGIGGPCLQVMC